MTRSLQVSYSEHAGALQYAPRVSLPTYSETVPRRPVVPKILFLAADSRTHIHSALVKRAKRWKNGFEQRHGSDEEAYIEGGEYGAKIVLDSAEEAHDIQNACDRGGFSANFKPFFNVRKEEFVKRVKCVSHAVFHFSGHCSAKYGLSLKQAAGVHEVSQTSVTSNELVGCYQGRVLQLAVLATCHSASIAQTLVEKGLAEVAIGTENSADDPEVVRFVSAFYDRLFGLGYGVDRQSRMQNVQKAYAHALSFVSPSGCKICVYPKLVDRVKTVKVKNEWSQNLNHDECLMQSKLVQNEY